MFVHLSSTSLCLANHHPRPASRGCRQARSAKELPSCREEVPGFPAGRIACPQMRRAICVDATYRRGREGGREGGGGETPYARHASPVKSSFEDRRWFMPCKLGRPTSSAFLPNPNPIRFCAQPTCFRCVKARASGTQAPLNESLGQPAAAAPEKGDNPLPATRELCRNVSEQDVIIGGTISVTSHRLNADSSIRG
jgi:hypothetical protein